MSVSLTAVIAITPGGVIGDRGTLPWRLGTDLRRFKRVTMGGVLIMGRKTYESIGRPLPGRESVVITRDPRWSSPGVSVAKSPEKAVEAAAGRPAFVVGGAEIYRELLPRCDELMLTRVWTDVRGDTLLEIDLGPFEVSESCRVPATSRDDLPTEYLKMARKKFW